MGHLTCAFPWKSKAQTEASTGKRDLLVIPGIEHTTPPIAAFSWKVVLAYLCPGRPFSYAAMLA